MTTTRILGESICKSIFILLTVKCFAPLALVNRNVESLFPLTAALSFKYGYIFQMLPYIQTSSLNQHAPMLIAILYNHFLKKGKRTRIIKNYLSIHSQEADLYSLFSYTLTIKQTKKSKSLIINGKRQINPSSEFNRIILNVYELEPIERRMHWQIKHCESVRFENTFSIEVRLMFLKILLLPNTVNRFILVH